MAQSPMGCADFLATVGVNTHLSYSDSQYNDLASVSAALKFIGLKYVRDAAIDQSKPNAQHYGALAADGIHFCLYWGPRRAMGEAIDQISTLERMYPGAVCGLEGPNELKPAFAYAGLAGNDAAKAFMAEMRRAAGLNAALRRTPLVNFTSYAPAASDCDFANAHPYPKMGKQPAEIIESVRQRFVGPAGVMPGKAMMFTEFGYHTLVGKPAKQGRWQGVSPEVQACLTLNALLDGASQGVSRTYLYQLLDGRRDDEPGGNQQHHFGLFNADGSPKPAARALKTLFAILRDDHPPAPGKAARPLDAQIDAPSSIHWLPLTHSSGRRFIVLWDESPVWDATSATALAVRPSTVNVTLPIAAHAAAFQLVNAGRRTDFAPSRRVAFPVGPGPVILSIG